MDASIINTTPQEFELMYRRLLAGVHTSAPGIIKSFDGKLATVQPAIKMQTIIGGKAAFIDMPVILNVPVVMPSSQTAELAITVPILPGDECLLIYAERAIDNFVEHGGVQPPIITADQSTAQGRTHDITDAICIPGILTAAHTIPNFSTDAIEIRDMTGNTVVSVKKGEIRAKDAGAEVTISQGKVTATAPVSAEITAPIIKATGNMTVTGTLTVSGIITGTGATKGAL